jgi:type IV pilus assembly protein PilV
MALVEAMVTILVFAIGMLGIVGLQTLALSSSSMSNQRTEATVLALDMADRMRANRLAVVAGAGAGYDAAVAANNACRTVYATSVGAAAACTSDQLAADDVFDWQGQVAQRLPVGLGRVCIDSTPDDGTSGAPACDGVGRAFAVKVWWSQRASENAAAAEQRFVLMVRP